MTQQPLDFGRQDRAERARQRLLRVLGDVVDELDVTVAAAACDARRSELLDALAGRDGRYFRIDWLLAICDIASPDQRRRLQEAAFPVHRPMTDAERLARLEQRIATQFGVAGAALVEESRR